MAEKDSGAPDAARLDGGFRLGPLRVEPRLSRVTDEQGEVRRLEPRAMAALVHLAAADDVVRRDELIDAVWQTTVSDEVVSRAISLIRQALGDSAREPRYVETIPKIGYRLLERARLDDDPPDAGPEPREPEAGRADPPARPERAEDSGTTPVDTGHGHWTLAAALLIAVAVVLVWFWQSGTGTSGGSSPTTIAILPLEDQLLSGEARPIGLGVADTLRTELGRDPGLRVLARSSSIAIAREAADARELGERFGIDAVLEGSVVQSQDRVVVQLSLSDAAEGMQRWARTFEGPPEGLFELGHEMVAAVAAELAGARAPAPRQSPTSAAYTTYLQGLHYLALRGEAELERADELFSRALEEDAGFDPARVALARTRALKPYWSARPEAEVFPDALALLDEVTTDDPSVRGVASGVRGFIAFRSWAWDDAARHFEAAIAEAPQDAGIRAWYAQYLAAVGDMEASLREALEAWDLDPGSPIVGTRVAAAYLWNDLPERSAPYYDATDPFALAIRDPSYLIWLLEQGRGAEVEPLIARLHGIAGRDVSWVPACMTLVTGSAQDATERDAALATFEEAVRRGDVLPRMLLPVWILAGEHERAAAVLETYRDQRQLFEVEFLFSPQAAGFRDTDAFARSLAVLGHPRGAG